MSDCESVQSVGDILVTLTLMEDSVEGKEIIEPGAADAISKSRATMSTSGDSEIECKVSCVPLARCLAGLILFVKFACAS